MLYGRDAELAQVDGLLAGARNGRSGVLVIRGEAGIGKSALLEYAAAQYGRIPGARVLRAVGIESELELPFAVLHLLLRPAIELIPTLPPPQALAISSAFGLTRAGDHDPFLIGLAVLTLLSDLAEDGPVLCLVDDAQWVDEASTRALTFAARRLDAEPVVALFAARDDPHDFDAAGLPELRLDGLDRSAASALLPDTPLAAAVRDRILDEAAGNPLTPAGASDGGHRRTAIRPARPARPARRCRHTAGPGPGDVRAEDPAAAGGRPGAAVGGGRRGPRRPRGDPAGRAGVRGLPVRPGPG